MDALTRMARKHAAPMLVPKSGLPLIKSTPSLGRMLEWRRGRSTYPSEISQGARRDHLLRDLGIFINWMEKEDGAHYRGKYYFDKPTPHFEPKPPDIQVGDRGGTRPVAHNLLRDASDPEREDTIIWALFDVPEAIQEIPTDLAIELFNEGKPNLRPLRERDWRGGINGSREYRSRNA